MTNTTMSARFAESDFRIGPVITRTARILSQHFLIFFLIGVVANLPSVLLGQGGELATSPTATTQGTILLIVGGLLSFVLSMISQAVMVHAAFQAMRMRPVSLGESLKVGLARVVPVFLVAILMGLLGGLAFLLLIVPGFIVMTMWFVSTPACVVERTGPWTSMKRSAALTKGHRWKVFGLLLLLVLLSAIVAGLLQVVLMQVGSTILVILGTLLWGALWTAYYSIAVVMTYHDLRVAKEGIDIEQIASVFD
jgi:uncharacterized membrane protein